MNGPFAKSGSFLGEGFVSPKGWFEFSDLPTPTQADFIFPENDKTFVLFPPEAPSPTCEAAFPAYDSMLVPQSQSQQSMKQDPGITGLNYFNTASPQELSLWSSNFDQTLPVSVNPLTHSTSSTPLSLSSASSPASCFQVPKLSKPKMKASAPRKRRRRLVCEMAPQERERIKIQARKNRALRKQKWEDKLRSYDDLGKVNDRLRAQIVTEKFRLEGLKRKAMEMVRMNRLAV